MFNRKPSSYSNGSSSDQPYWENSRNQRKETQGVKKEKFHMPDGYFC